MRIGFLQYGWLGDALLATAVLHELRKTHADAHITWVILEAYSDVLAGNGEVNAVVAWPTRSGKKVRKEMPRAWRAIKRWAKREFDRVVIPQIYPEVRERQGVALVDQMFERSGLAPVDRPRLVLASQPAPLWNQPYVAINVRAISRRPLWGDDDWRELARLLNRQGIGTICGCDGLRGVMSFRGSVGQWRTIIENAIAYAGPDSGGMWVAATTRTPQVVVRNPQTNERWLSGLGANRVKDASLVHDPEEPVTPAQVAEHLVEIARRRLVLAASER